MVHRYFIYALIDPRTRLVRYVGKTTKGLRRVKEHGQPWRLKLHDRCAKWLRHLVKHGFVYEHTVLQYSDSENLDTDERWWITYGKLSKWPLTNLTEGGEGSAGRKLSKETRAKISRSLTGKKASPEAVEKCRQRMLGNTYTLGFRHSEQSKALMSQQRKGLKKSESTLVKMRESQRLRRKWTEEDLVRAVSVTSNLNQLGKYLRISRTHGYRLREHMERLGLKFKGDK